jgi:hypothetical protein
MSVDDVGRLRSKAELFAGKISGKAHIWRELLLITVPHLSGCAPLSMLENVQIWRSIPFGRPAMLETIQTFNLGIPSNPANRCLSRQFGFHPGNLS